MSDFVWHRSTTLNKTVENSICLRKSKYINLNGYSANPISMPDICIWQYDIPDIGHILRLSYKPDFEDEIDTRIYLDKMSRGIVSIFINLIVLLWVIVSFSMFSVKIFYN